MKEQKEIKTRLAELRRKMEQYDLDGYMVPTTDEYLGEYTGEYAKRMKYVTGFTGTFGIAIITLGSGVLFTDSRYFLQANNELPKDFKIEDISRFKNKNCYKELFIDHEIARVGYDPMLFSSKILQDFSPENIELVGLYENLVDYIWQDQVEKPASEIYIYPLQYAGEPFSDKITKLRGELANKRASSLVITESDMIAWLLNLRARDLEVAPILHGYLLITIDKAILYVRTQRVGPEIMDYLAPEVEVRPEDKFIKQLKEAPGPVLVCKSKTPAGVTQAIEKAGNIVYEQNFPAYWHELKAQKNPTELEGIKRGHINDAIALCEFFTWLEKISMNGKISNYNEYDIIQYLYEFRASQPYFAGASFPTICGFNENGAIIHYTASPDSAAYINDTGLLLIDSGGQYKLGCTTDVTRVMPIGKPTSEQIKNYTLVLKGHIDLASTIFPDRTSGVQLDAIARRSLWANGLNYGHGTGHGVGAFLNVHEAPPGISPQTDKNQKFKSGMVCSNEPGYYKENSYGIRIENLIFTKESSYSGFLEFENLTLVPYAKELIDKSMLNTEQISYLENYYQDIADKVLPYLSNEAGNWLKSQLEPILKL